MRWDSHVEDDEFEPVVMRWQTTSDGTGLFVPESSVGDALIWLNDDGVVHAMDYVFELVTAAELRVLLDLPKDAPLPLCLHSS